MSGSSRSGTRTGIRSSTLETALAAVMWVLFLITFSVVALTAPAVTKNLVRALDVAEDAGISEEAALEAAENVRQFVATARRDALPAMIEGREAFGASEESHLRDVRAVLSLMRTVTGATALALAGWIGWLVARRQRDRIARGMRAGGWAALGTVAAVGLFALAGFDRAFRAMHGFFFEEGTWEFPADSLLIQLFPEPFWMAMGAAVVSVVAAGGLGLVLVGRRLPGRVEVTP